MTETSRPNQIMTDAVEAFLTTPVGISTTVLGGAGLEVANRASESYDLATIGVGALAASALSSIYWKVRDSYQLRSETGELTIIQDQASLEASVSSAFNSGAAELGIGALGVASAAGMAWGVGQIIRYDRHFIDTVRIALGSGAPDRARRFERKAYSGPWCSRQATLMGLKRVADLTHNETLLTAGAEHMRWSWYKRLPWIPHLIGPMKSGRRFRLISGQLTMSDLETAPGASAT